MLAFAHQFLRLGGIVPEVRIFRFFVELNQSIVGDIPVKDASSADLPPAGFH
jgi:hypothetical protein